MPGRFTGSVLGPHRPGSEGNLAGDLENKDPQAVTTLPEQDKAAEEPRTAAPAPKPAASATDSNSAAGAGDANGGAPPSTATETASPAPAKANGAAKGDGQHQT